MEKNITLTKVDDFLKYLHSGFPRNFVEDGETIPENSCSYNDTFKAFRINDASSELKGSLQIYLGELSIGDKVDINVEVMNISGVKAKIAVDYEPPVGGVANLFTLQSKKTGEFERIGGSFLSTRNGRAMAAIGVFTTDIGDFYVRNVDIKVKSKNNYAYFVEFETLLSKNAIMHNNIYRGKFLGNSVTPEQYQAISSGTFEDLYIGDYWTIDGVNYRIAGFDYYYNTGDIACTTHHAVIVPDTILYTYAMNDTNTTEGGYVNSKMYTEGLAQALSTVKSAFSDHVLKHRRLLSNATSDGKASGWAWFDSEVELMTEPMVYGSVVWGESTIGGSGYNIGVDKSQLPLFALNPRMINTRQSYWLRDVVSGPRFAFAYADGDAFNGDASLNLGVRPTFSIS